MSVTTVLDLDGHAMPLYRLGNKPWMFSTKYFNHEFIEKVPEYPLRDDDILFCSYPKSGCHWVWEITRMLLTGSGQVNKTPKEQYFFEANGTRLGTDIDSLPSPRILNNHLPFDHQPADMLKKKTKVVFVYRNPKDVAVSLYYHSKKLYYNNSASVDFRSFLRRIVDGLVPDGFQCDYLRGWDRGIKENKDLKICLISYEDLQDNPFREVTKLAQFLEKDYDEEFLQKVIKETHIDNMRSVKVGPDGKYSMMYRKGKVGDWKNHFTVAESEWFDHVVRYRMEKSDLFTFRYEI